VSHVGGICSQSAGLQGIPKKLNCRGADYTEISIGIKKVQDSGGFAEKRRSRHFGMDENYHRSAFAAHDSFSTNDAPPTQLHFPDHALRWGLLKPAGSLWYLK
jgi:hypothetical protein